MHSTYNEWTMTKYIVHKDNNLHEEPLQLRTGTGLEEAKNVCKVGVGHPKHEQLKLLQSAEVGVLDDGG